MSLILTCVLVLFCASQIYWALRARNLARRVIRRGSVRVAAGGIALAVYAFLLAFNFGWLGNESTPTHMTLGEALFAAPFLWWFASSIFGFLVASIVSPVQRLARRGGDPKSPGRRRFLEQAARAATAAPFAAGAYGLLYGRLNLETTQQRIRLPRLPRAFEGFRIAQLSDIHIGPFMSAEEIRKYVAIANALKPDLTVLTGDFVTWDSSTQEAVVDALSGLRAPFGIFGCLGNHDAWTGVQDSITALFARAGIRILRQQRAAISTQGEELNLLGVDFQTHRRMGPSMPAPRFLIGVEDLMAQDRVNILLSHNPNTFDRAAELGIDLSLAGHTHGGQLALEFISPELAPSRLVTPYVAGLFQKPGGQLYVNRGIGTIGVPIRVGAPPEITVFELIRG
jgi:uncharacterized protein